MSIQAQLDNHALTYVPEILKIIKASEFFEANQIRCATIRAMLDANIPIAEMDLKQLKSFERKLIESFKRNGWIK